MTDTDKDQVTGKVDEVDLVEETKGQESGGIFPIPIAMTNPAVCCQRSVACPRF